jgi:hypothetical protein
MRWYIHHHNMICGMGCWCISHTGILHNQPSRSSLCCFSLLCMYCENITLAQHAYYTVLCSTITTLGCHHTSCTSTSAAKAPRFPSTVLHRSRLVDCKRKTWTCCICSVGVYRCVNCCLHHSMEEVLSPSSPDWYVSVEFFMLWLAHD